MSFGCDNYVLPNIGCDNWGPEAATRKVLLARQFGVQHSSRESRTPSPTSSIRHSSIPASEHPIEAAMVTGYQNPTAKNVWFYGGRQKQACFRSSPLPTKIPCHEALRLGNRKSTGGCDFASAVLYTMSQTVPYNSIGNRASTYLKERRSSFCSSLPLPLSYAQSPSPSSTLISTAKRLRGHSPGMHRSLDNYSHLSCASSQHSSELSPSSSLRRKAKMIIEQFLAIRGS